MRLSGLEPMDYVPNTEDMRSTFLYIGERCNVAGSSIYKKVNETAAQSSRQDGQHRIARRLSETCLSGDKSVL